MSLSQEEASREPRRPLRLPRRDVAAITSLVEEAGLYLRVCPLGVQRDDFSDALRPYVRCRVSEGECSIAETMREGDTLTALRVATKSGPRTICGDLFIDATGMPT